MYLRWVEYKIICDKCYQDIIGWSGYETPKEVREAYKLEFGTNPAKGYAICEDCKKKPKISPKIPEILPF